MKNVNWRVKAVYLLIAAVLAIGGVAGLIATVPKVSAMHSVTYSATLTATPVYAGVNEAVEFTFTCNLPNSVFTAHGDLGDLLSGSYASGSWVMSWPDEGRYHVAMEAYDGNVDLWGHTDVRISGYMLDPGLAHNVLGQSETFSLPAGLVPGSNCYVTWSVGGSALPYIQTPWVGGGINDDSITVNCISIAATLEGVEAVVTANVWTGGEPIGTPDVYEGVKMWGKIDNTALIPMVEDQNLDLVPATTRSSAVIWNENDKAWEGGISVMETVLGSYNTNPTVDNPTGIIEIPANGAVVHWFVVDSTADISGLASLTSLSAIEAAIGAMPDANLIDLEGGTGSRNHKVTTSGDFYDGVNYVEGVTSIGVSAEGEEAVYIIAVATYPDATISLPVSAEIETWNFYTNEVDVVPQVRWVGEKIVLEKYWGESYDGCIVHYAITTGKGTLESVDASDVSYYGSLNLVNNAQSVWTQVHDGISRVILQCGDPMEVQVLASVYDQSYGYGAEGGPINEHLFVVYFLKLEDITLGNVEGERVDNPLTNATVEGHDSGLFDPANPWADPWGSDEATYLANGGVVGPVDSTTGTLNISQDTLLRARVRGWFMGNQDQDSGREARKIDSNHDGKIDFRDITLPAGRWVLPDDWQYLASIDLQGYNPYWDIMSAPNSNVMSDADGNPNPEQSLDTLGAYVTWGKDPVNGNDMITGLVKEWPVIGPYSSLDDYTPDGFWRGTIVPDGQLNWWDCPMPAVKVTFQIGDGLGYFKEVAKGDVYYALLDTNQNIPGVDAIAYTNPYYAIMNPANPFLSDVAFVNNGGYDWNSWNNDYGPYDLWHFVNQQGSDINYPTMVQVYSDNHGEAMVWLNGDNNLDLNGQASWWDGMEYTTGTYLDKHDNAVNPVGWADWTDIASEGVPVKVGNTTAVATAMYPYFRSDPALYSNTVTKDWLWGENKLVDVMQLEPNEGETVYGHKLVLVWLKDRDGMAAAGLRVEWHLVGDASLLKGNEAHGANLPINWIDDTHAVSVTWIPSPDQVSWYWNSTKLGDCGSALAGVEVSGNDPFAAVYLDVNIYTAEGTLVHSETIYLNQEDMIDPLLNAGLNSGVYQGKAQSIVDATQTIKGNLVAIWWQDNGVWHAYQPAAPDWANDLSMLEPGNTYFVRVSADCFWNWALN